MKLEVFTFDKNWLFWNLPQKSCRFLANSAQFLDSHSRYSQNDWTTFESIDVLSYSIASGILVTLTIVKCWNINHQNHKHTYSHEVHDQNDRSNRCNTLYGCDDWYFSIWHVSMSQEFHWQLSNWVGPMWLILRVTLSVWVGAIKNWVCSLLSFQPLK